MDRWLTWRFAGLTVCALTVFAYLAPPRVADVALVLGCIVATVSACRAYGQVPARGRFPVAAMAVAQVLAIAMTSDRLLHDGKAGLIGSVAGTLTVVCYFLFSLGIVRARRPAEYQDGFIDGFAATAGFLAIQWQFAALLPGATAASVAATLPPFIGAIYAVSAVVMLYGVARDPRQNKLIPASIVAAAVVILASSWGHASYTLTDPPGWTIAMALIGAFLKAAIMAHPDFGRTFEPEPYRRRILQMRWIGPVGALLATPTMLLLFVTSSAVPTLGASAVCGGLMAIALWRGRKLMREHVQSQRDLLAEQRFRSLLQHAADVVVVLDDSRRISYVSGSVDLITGPGTDVIGWDLGQLLQAEGTAAVGTTMAEVGRHLDSRQLADDVLVHAGDGRPHWLTISVTNHCATPGIEGWVLNIREVTARKEAETALSRLALHDALTGLPNRAQMRGRLESALGGPGGTAVLFCDLDGFKAVNDDLGHESGDELLRQVAARWSAVLRREDVLGRWGGDEFLVVCTGLTDVAEASVVADRLRSALQTPVDLPTGSAHVGVSIGLALHHPGETVDELLARADAGMYTVKRANRSVRAA